MDLLHRLRETVIDYLGHGGRESALPDPPPVGAATTTAGSEVSALPLPATSLPMVHWHATRKPAAELAELIQGMRCGLWYQPFDSVCSAPEQPPPCAYPCRSSTRAHARTRHMACLTGSACAAPSPQLWRLP